MVIRHNGTIYFVMENFDAGNAPGLGEKNRGTFRRAASVKLNAL
jgi:hypothetical protein